MKLTDATDFAASPGIIYRLDASADRIIISAIMHMARKPDAWKGRG